MASEKDEPAVPLKVSEAAHVKISTTASTRLVWRSAQLLVAVRVGRRHEHAHTTIILKLDARVLTAY